MNECCDYRGMIQYLLGTPVYIAVILRYERAAERHLVAIAHSLTGEYQATVKVVINPSESWMTITQID